MKKRIISISLVLSMIIQSMGIVVYANDELDNIPEIQLPFEEGVIEDENSEGKIDEEVIADSSTESVDTDEEYIVIDEQVITRKEFVNLLNQTTPEESQQATPRLAGMLAVYFVPTLGEVILLATGAILIAGQVYESGTWQYSEFDTWRVEMIYTYLT